MGETGGELRFRESLPSSLILQSQKYLENRKAEEQWATLADS